MNLHVVFFRMGAKTNVGRGSRDYKQGGAPFSRGEPDVYESGVGCSGKELMVVK